MRGRPRSRRGHPSTARLWRTRTAYGEPRPGSRLVRPDETRPAHSRAGVGGIPPEARAQNGEGLLGVRPQRGPGDTAQPSPHRPTHNETCSYAPDHFDASLGSAPCGLVYAPVCTSAGAVVSKGLPPLPHPWQVGQVVLHGTCPALAASPRPPPRPHGAQAADEEGGRRRVAKTGAPPPCQHLAIKPAETRSILR